MKLIKTSIDFELNKDERDSIFLGTWCHTKKSIISEDKNIHVAQYHWDERDKYNADYNYLSNLYEKNLQLLTESLNNIHSLDRDVGYWRMVVGPWLRFFTDALFDRYECIRLAKEKDVFTNVTLHDYKKIDQAPNNFKDFYNVLYENTWNEKIFSECIKFLKINYEKSSIEINEQNVDFSDNQSGTKNFLRKLVLVYQKILPNKLNNIIVIEPYIKFLDSIKLQIQMKQFPILIPPEINIKNTDLKIHLRENLKNLSNDNKFENFLLKSLYKNIPQAYVELFSKFQEQSLSVYPNNSKIIYTANSYQANDGFKIWAAEQCHNKNSKLVIGQHGGNFGTGLVNQSEDHQLEISDSFVSWGWKRKGYSNIVSLPSIKLSSNSIKKHSSPKFLFVTPSFPRFFFCHYSMPVAGQFLKCIKSQVGFMEKLNKRNFHNTHIRLDASGEKFGWNIYDFLCSKGLQDKIINQKKSLMEVLNNYSLCICDNNATVFLETLAINFPTVIYLDPRYYEIRPESIESFNGLKRCGILHNDSKSAAEFLNNMPTDISSWWHSPEVQNARKFFNQNFAQSSSVKNSIRSLSSFLKNMLQAE